MKLARLRLSPPIVPTAAAAVLFVLLCSLGFWQLDRAAGKEAAQVRFEAARSTVLDETTVGREPFEFARVDLGGRYDPVHQFLQDNRTYRGRSGYHVLTPFRTASHGAVLVTRGWVPADPDRSFLPEIAAPRGTVRLQGTVRLPREDLFVLGDTGYSAPGWPRVVQRVELDAMQRSLGYPLADWLVALDPVTPHGYVREWKAAPGLTPDRHRGYAFSMVCTRDGAVRDLGGGQSEAFGQMTDRRLRRMSNEGRMDDRGRGADGTIGHTGFIVGSAVSGCPPRGWRLLGPRPAGARGGGAC